MTQKIYTVTFWETRKVIERALIEVEAGTLEEARALAQAVWDEDDYTWEEQDEEAVGQPECSISDPETGEKLEFNPDADE